MDVGVGIPGMDPRVVRPPNQMVETDCRFVRIERMEGYFLQYFFPLTTIAFDLFSLWNSAQASMINGGKEGFAHGDPTSPTLNRLYSYKANIPSRESGRHGLLQ